MDKFIDIVFDGPLGAQKPRFLEVEGPDGRSVAFGDWTKRGDGFNVLRVRPGDFEQALESEPPDPTVFPNDE